MGNCDKHFDTEQSFDCVKLLKYTFTYFETSCEFKLSNLATILLIRDFLNTVLQTFELAIKQTKIYSLARKTNVIIVNNNNLFIFL